MTTSETIQDANAAPRRPAAAPKTLKLLNQSHWRAIEDVLSGLREGRSILVVTGPEGAGAEAVLRETVSSLPRRLLAVEGRPEQGDLSDVVAPLHAVLARENVRLTGEDQPVDQVMKGLESLACEDRGVVYFLDPQQPLTDAGLVFLARLAAAGRRLTRERRAVREETETPLRGPVGAQIVLCVPQEALHVLCELGDGAMRRAAENPIKIELSDGSALRASFRQHTGGVLAPGAIEVALASTGGRLAELEQLLSHPFLLAAARSEGVAGAEGESAVITAEAAAEAAAQLGLSAPEEMNTAELELQDLAYEDVAGRQDCQQGQEGQEGQESQGDQEDQQAQVVAADEGETEGSSPTALAEAAIGQSEAQEETETADAEGDVASLAPSQSAQVDAERPAEAAQETVTPIPDVAASEGDETVETDAAVETADSTDLADALEMDEDEELIGDPLDDDALEELLVEVEEALQGALAEAEESLTPEAMEVAGKEPENQPDSVAETMLAALGVHRRPTTAERLRIKAPAPARTLGATRRHAVILASLGVCVVAALATGMGGVAADYGRKLAGYAMDAPLYETADARLAPALETDPQGDDASSGLMADVVQGALATAEQLARGAAESIAPTDEATQGINRLADSLYSARVDIVQNEFEEQLASLTPDEARIRRETMIADCLRKAEDHASAGRFTAPEDSNAYAELLKAYRLAPRDPRVRGALAGLVRHYENQAALALDDERYEVFHGYTRIADRIRGRMPI